MKTGFGEMTKTLCVTVAAFLDTATSASDLSERGAFRALYQELVEINTSLSADNCIQEGPCATSTSCLARQREAVN